MRWRPSSRTGWVRSPIVAAAAIKAGWRGRFCRRSRANSCEPAQLLGSWQWAVRPDMSRPNPAGLIYQPPSFSLLSTSCQAQLSLRAVRSRCRTSKLCHTPTVRKGSPLFRGGHEFTALVADKFDVAGDNRLATARIGVDRPEPHSAVDKARKFHTGFAIAVDLFAPTDCKA